MPLPARLEESPRARRPISRRDALALALGLPLLAFLVVPVAAVLVKAPGALVGRLLRDPEVAQTIGLSLGTSMASTALAIGFGTPLAYLLARREFRGRSAVEILVELPVVLPPSVAGLALLLVFGRFGLLGPALEFFDVRIAFTTAAVVLAQAFVASPFYVKSAAAGIAAVDRQFEEAAAVDGAGRWGVFRHVTAPLAGRGLLAGATLCWARALGEFGATILFAGNLPGRTQTMPLAVYMGFETDLDRAVALAAILIVFSLALLLAARAAVGRVVLPR